ncbi:MAG: DUF1501 domain-containing protein [Parvibaculum sp.]|nr:DUF1501 domain-containing protein [Parvibaculum sp.]
MAAMSLDRRRFLALAGSSTLAALAGTNFSFAAGADGGPSLVVVNLRGGMDGLSLVVPYADPHYVGHRRGLALAAPGKENGVFDIDGFFGLHPALAFCNKCRTQGELLSFTGVASPYRSRSHFDAQDMLANGTNEARARSGWLNRSLPFLGNEGEAVAVGTLVPLLLRGEAPVTSWIPPISEAPDETFLVLMDQLYAEDALLGNVWAQNRQREMEKADSIQKGDKPFVQACSVAAEMLNADGGPRVISLELPGWDTHAKQGATDGRLAVQFSLLDEGLARLAGELSQEQWQKTAILVVSEFGRTVRANGTGGTDHGTGGAMLLLGGAVAGGRVVNEWRGLDSKGLYEDRDLYPSIDLRSVFKSVLHDHMKIASRSLESHVFPDSPDARRMADLIRA